MKRVQAERESAALEAYLDAHGPDDLLTSAIARAEVIRAVRVGGVEVVNAARQLLRKISILAVDDRVLERAATLDTGADLRTLDAIHLASALEVAPELRDLVTYDRRMARAAAALRLPVSMPS